MYVCIHEIIRLIIMKVNMKMKNRSLRYDVIDLETYEAQFTKKLSNTEGKLK